MADEENGGCPTQDEEANNCQNISANPRGHSLERKFDVTVVYEALQKCGENDSGVDMDNYIIAFKEFHRFFILLGPVFGFVASDISSKIDILEGYRRSEDGINYQSIEKMILYEESNKLLDKPNRPSGSRTLLRLHRALEFIASFMKNLSAAGDNEATSTIARKCYLDTLARFHPWLIKKGALLALYSLPTRKGLIQRVYGDAAPLSDINLLAGVAENAEVVYRITQSMYETHDLLNLP